MTTLTSFSLFPTLPTEIRLKIWSLTLPTERTVHISCQRNPITSSQRHSIQSWTAKTSTPSALGVNQESRHEALQKYQAYFFYSDAVSSGPIHLCLSQDTLKMGDRVLAYLPAAVLDDVQKLALSTKDAAYFGCYNMEILKAMRGLQELSISAGRGARLRGDHAERYWQLLIADFVEAVEGDPEWDCPVVRLFEVAEGRMLAVYPGGQRLEGERGERWRVV